jgi:hypothetical protein
MPHHLMAAPKTTINDVLGILNAVNKWAYSSRNIATVALKGLITCRPVSWIQATAVACEYTAVVSTFIPSQNHSIILYA